MNIIKKTYCRIYQTIMHLLIPIMPYREPELYYDINDIKQILNKEKLYKPLIITCNSMVKNQTISNLNLDNSTIYSSVKSNPTDINVKEGKELYLNNNCDCIIAIGGGSVIDCAKAVASVVSSNKELYKLKGLLKVRKINTTIIAIPTTAGTGSEATIASVIVDSKTRDKYVINDYCLIPKYAILDYKLTLSMPKSLIASTAMDALTHSLEAYLGYGINKKQENNALKSIKLILDNILIAYNNPDNEKAREQLLYGSYLAGIVFTNCFVGYVHSISHSLSGKYNLAHGLTNAIILPYVLEEYGEKINKKVKKIQLYLNNCKEKDDDNTVRENFINLIKSLNDKFDFSSKIDCLKQQDIKELAIKADREANPLYPVIKLMDNKQLEEIYYKLLP